MTGQHADRLAVGRYLRHREARVHALVLAAMEIPHWLIQEEGGHVLLVRLEDLPRARRELELYDRENPPVPVMAQAVRVLARGWAGALGWCLVLIVVFLLDHQRVGGLDWHRAGRVEAGPLLAGEWWRSVTALTLHADLFHLLGNLVIGAAFVALACQLLGTGVACAGTLLAGVLGNYLDAWARDPGHLSLGASTAVFGALGLIMGAQAQDRRGQGCMRMIAPVVVGLLLLAWMGMSGQRVNILAHCTGLGSGVVVGAWLSHQGLHRRLGSVAQRGLALSALALVAVAWSAAL